MRINHLPLHFVTQPDVSDGSQQLNQKFILFFSAQLIAEIKTTQANSSFELRESTTYTAHVAKVFFRMLHLIS